MVGEAELLWILRFTVETVMNVAFFTQRLDQGESLLFSLKGFQSRIVFLKETILFQLEIPDFVLVF